MKYGAIAIRGGTAGMDSFSAEFTVLHLMTPRRSGLPRHKDYRRVADDLTRNRQSGESVDRGDTTGLCVGGQSVGSKRAAGVQVLVERLQTHLLGSTGQPCTVTVSPNSWRESASKIPR